MAKLEYNVYEDPTLKAMDEALELKQKLEKPRNYLGASEIGNECERYLFYSFRNAKARVISAKGIKAIEDGFDQEAKTIERLRMLPFIELHTTDGTFDKDGNPNQIGFDDMLLGHVRGHVDGMIKGLLQATSTWHIFEHKSVNEKKFNELKKLIEEKGEKEALYHWDTIYYGQAQLYMHRFELTRHYLVCSTPGGRDHISVRTEYKRAYAEMLIEKAKNIIFDNWNIPARISDRREYYKCQWCNYQSICHDGEVPDINCKTCRYRDCIDEGKSKCLLDDTIIEETLLNVGCQSHIYNPALMPECKLVEHQEDGCIYHIPEKNFYFANTNLTGFPDVKGQLDAIFTSKELKEKIKNINNLGVATAKVQKAFSGEISPKVKPWDSLSNDHSKLRDI